MRALQILSIMLAGVVGAGCSAFWDDPGDAVAPIEDQLATADGAAAGDHRLAPYVGALDQATAVCDEDRELIGRLVIQAQEFAFERGDDLSTLEILDAIPTAADGSEGTFDCANLTALLVATTTSEQAPVPSVAPRPPAQYEGEKLGGGNHVITAGQGDYSQFNGEQPSEIVTISRFIASDDCQAVQDKAAFWFLLVDDTDGGQAASVYAQHALNVAAFMECS